MDERAEGHSCSQDTASASILSFPLIYTAVNLVDLKLCMTYKRKISCRDWVDTGWEHDPQLRMATAAWLSQCRSIFLLAKTGWIVCFRATTSLKLTCRFSYSGTARYMYTHNVLKVPAATGQESMQIGVMGQESRIWVWPLNIRRTYHGDNWYRKYVVTATSGSSATQVTSSLDINKGFTGVP